VASVQSTLHTSQPGMPVGADPAIGNRTRHNCSIQTAVPLLANAPDVPLSAWSTASQLARCVGARGRCARGGRTNAP
jgi:hypothetical protein